MVVPDGVTTEFEVTATWTEVEATQDREFSRIAIVKFVTVAGRYAFGASGASSASDSYPVAADTPVQIPLPAGASRLVLAAAGAAVAYVTIIPQVYR